MNSLGEIKNKLDNIYNNLDNIEKFGIDTTDYKDQIDSFDLMCEKFDSNSNTNVQVKFSRSQKKEYEILYKSIELLEKHILGINKSLGLITYLEELDLDKALTLEDEDTAKKELDIIVAFILDYLLTINQFKNILKPELFDSVMEKLYQIIKYEFKYTGKSLILNYMYPNLHLTNKFFEVWKKDYEKNKDSLKSLKDIDNLYEYRYYLNSTIKTIALNEDGFLQDKEKELSNLINKYEINKENKEEAETTLKQKKALQKNRRKGMATIYSRFLPILVSLGVLVGSNVGVNKLIKNNSKYKTTTEYYSSLTDETTTEDGYSKLSVGDTRITIYYPIDEKNARIIKQYDLNEPSVDIEKWTELNYDSLDFSSSTYKVDDEANKKSTEQFIEVEKVTNIDINEKNPSIVLMILASITVSLITLLLDYKSKDLTNRNTIFLHDLINPNEVKRIYNIEKSRLNKEYPKQNMKFTKDTLRQRIQVLKDLEKEYEDYYSKYEYISEYLENDGYTRKLK